MVIRRLGPSDATLVLAAADLFDRSPRPDATERFLNEPGHHLLAAFDGERMTGFVSGVEMTHPDKGTEMLLYELSVAEDARRRGIGTALVSALVELATSRGCYGMWVLTDEDNVAAHRTYEAAGGRVTVRQVMFGWEPAATSPAAP